MTQKTVDLNSIGINHPGFAVSEKELMNWINGFYCLNLKGKEDLRGGAHYVQVLDSIYPEMNILQSKAYRKVRFDYVTDYDLAKNWKLLQVILNGKGVTRNIPIQDILKKKPGASLQLLQWMKLYFDAHYQGNAYDAEARRYRGPKKGAPDTAGPKVWDPKSTPIIGKSKHKECKEKKVKGKKKTGKAKVSGSKIDEMKAVVASLEKERNFYFGKLREIELMCQATESGEDEFIEKEEVLKVLYVTDEDGDFQAPVDCEVEEDGDDSSF